MTVRQILPRYYEGLSTDDKPSNVVPTSLFRETDTYSLYKTFDGDTWVITDWVAAEGIAGIVPYTSLLFPNLSSDIDLTCTLTAGTSKSFGTWAELEDSSANKLSTVAEGYILHISALRVIEMSEPAKLYVLEIGYGPSAGDVTCIDPHDYGHAIPKGEKVYGRVKCETDGATATIVLWYHYEE